MAKSNVDYQQLLLQYGEWVGLGVAGVFAAGLVGLSLMSIPGSGPAANAKELETPTAEVSRKLTDSNNLPGDNDKPPPGAGTALVALNTTPVVSDGYDVKPLAAGASGGEMGRRNPKVYPIEEATGRPAHVQVQSYIFIDSNPPKVIALRDPAAKGGAGGAEGGAGGGAAGRLGQLMGGRGGAGGRPGGMMGGGMGMMGGGMGMMGGGGMMGPGGMGMLMEGDTKRDKQTMPIALDKLDKSSNYRLAEQARPLRCNIIAASFPYKKQVEEFRSRLGLRAVGDVLGETMTETKPDKTQVTVNAFRFLGVVVERRELDGDGNPLKGPAGEYKEVDVTKTYRPFVVMTGRRLEPEDPELAPISFDGLVMPKLQQFRKELVGGGSAAAGPAGGMMGMMMGMGPGGAGGTRPGGGMVGGSRPPAGGPGSGGGLEGTTPGAPAAAMDPLLDKYPAVERELETIKKTLADLKGKKITEIAAPPSRFNVGDEFNPFSRGEEPPAAGAGGLTGEGGMGTMAPGTGAGGGGMIGSPMRPGTGSGTSGTGRDAPAGVGATAGQELELPEYCLVRLMDVTVEPGKSYEYRMKVRMANPNYMRTDVASTDYREKKEILSDWSKATVKVRMNPELVYYAVDQEVWQKQEEPKQRYENMYRNQFFNRERMIFLQAHRWLDTVKLKDAQDPMLFGEWTIAERLPVFKGEYVGKTEKIEAPVWRYTREDWVLAADPLVDKRRALINVYFGYAPDETKQTEAILVDFDLGKHGYRRTEKSGDDDPKVGAPVMEDVALEALIMMPDGKLQLLEGARDYNDEERIDRLTKVRKRIREVKEGGPRPAPGGGAPGGGGAGGGGGDG